MIKLRILVVVFILLSLYGVAQLFPFAVHLQSGSLSTTTKSLLEQIQAPIKIKLFTNNIDSAHQITLLVEKYQSIKPNIEFLWQKENKDILVIEYQQHEEKLNLHQNINEASLTKALFQTQQKQNHWIVFLQGHGEPSLYRDSPSSLRLFRMGLENQGFQVKGLNLQETALIPDNVQVLIIASPQSRFLPQEEQIILQYLSQGKDLLWLTAPGDYQPGFLRDFLGIEILDGVIHDPYGQSLGTPFPTITLITEFPKLPFPAPLSLCALPNASALISHSKHFKPSPLLVTDKSSFIPGKAQGPFQVGLLLLHDENKSQRIAVIGNSRFLSDGVIQNYGNLALGLNLIHWLNQNDLQIDQPVVENQMPNLTYARALLIQYGYPGICLIFLTIALAVNVNRLRRH